MKSTVDDREVLGAAHLPHDLPGPAPQPPTPIAAGAARRP